MPFSVTDNLFQLVIFINHEDNGFSETYYLDEYDRSAALVTAAALVEARSFVMAKNHVIIWAEIRQHTPTRNIQAVIGDPIPALPQWDYTDNDGDGLLFRFDTDMGLFSNHLIRGVEDGEIYRGRWTRAPFAIPAGPVARPADPTTADKADLWRYFLTFFRDHTVHREILGPNGDGIFQWNKYRYPLVMFKKVGARRMSSAYRRVSAEWALWERAADFSFCGTVCTVQRVCRVVAAHAYLDGPAEWLRFYWADEAAAVYADPHIFWGVYRDKEIHNAAAPGELTGPRLSVWNPAGVWEWQIGLPYGAAPGLAPTGPASRFLGLDPCPYDPLFDTPDELRPECDMTTFSFTFRDDRPNTFDVTSALVGTFENRAFLVGAGDPREAVIDLKQLAERGEMPTVAAWQLWMA